MNIIRIPDTYNYIGLFITFGCNLGCSYCINHFEQKLTGRKMISGKRWVDFLERLQSRPDLPVTLQGGEPSLHPDFIYIINHCNTALDIDILTNLQFNIDEFIQKVDPQRLKRNSPYASIRVSYHPQNMDLDNTIEKVLKMLRADFSIGIWSVQHPECESAIKEAKRRCADAGIDFRTKEFLGEYQGKIYGTYKYPDACHKKFKKKVLCKASEVLIDPAGRIFRCHHDLYKGINSIGDISDPAGEIKDIYRECSYFGFCNPCDIKVKTNRFQNYGHTSVDIRF